MLTLLCDFSSVLQSIWGVILALLVLLFMITVHEFGHFIAGRILGFQINEFAIGMGPKLLSKKSKKSGTEYSLRLLPLGGFCAFEGEESDTDNPKAFNKQAPWKRIIVLISGALFNFVSAIIICSILFLCYGDRVAIVQNVDPNAPQIHQQLQDKVIYKIDGKKVYLLEGISKYVDENMTIEVIDEKGEHQILNGVTATDYVTYSIAQKSTDLKFVTEDGNEVILSANADTIQQVIVDGKTITFFRSDDLDTILADDDKIVEIVVAHYKSSTEGELVTLNATAKQIKDNFSWTENTYKGIGITISYATYRFGFGESLSRVLPYCSETAMLVLRTVGGLITGAVGLSEVGGPISTIGITSQVVTTGFSNVLFLIVLISVNLAVFNLLPVPALDGCQVIFTIIEWIVGKPINRKVQGWINGIGLVLLLAFAIFVDVLKL